MAHPRLFVIGLAASSVLSGCGERNFVPGSPMAHLFGYNRTYEEIAAEDCQKQFGFQPGSEMLPRCVYELSTSRRQSDAAYMAASASMAAAGFSMMQQQQYQYQQPITTTHTYMIDGRRPINCSTTGTVTSCF